MEPGDNQPTRDEGDRTSDGCISRRSFVVGGLLAVTGGSHLLNNETLAQFRANVAASGTVKIDDEPTLSYQIIENNPSGKTRDVQYDINYQVEWVQGFQSIDVYVDNDPNDQYDPGADAEDSFTSQSTSGSFSTDTFWKRGGDTFEFIFDITSSAGDGFQKIVTDTSGDGSGGGDDDFGSANSPEFDWILVDDRTGNNSGAIYDVYYEITNRDEFAEVRTQFKVEDEQWANATDASTDSPIGLTQYQEEGGTDGKSFDIVAEAIDTNGLPTDSVTISDVADGDDPDLYGDPMQSDSPQIDSFTVTDNTTNQTEFVVEYTISNTDRLDRVEVTFDNLDKDSADETKSESSPVKYTRNGTKDHTYHITVEAFEARDGYTFPIDSGTVEDVADGSDSPTTYPEDAI